ncbi:hypothetical protein [Cupriavidus campinensis]
MSNEKNNEAASVAQGLTLPQMEMLRALLVSIRPEYGTPGSRDAEIGRQQKRIDAALAILTQPTAPVTAAARDVLAERCRQVSDEGWTPEHDDAHEGGELADAAAALILEAGDYRLAALQHWPWADAIKDAPPRRNLVKAGALVLAEIERLDRAAGDSSDRAEITPTITANSAVNANRAQIVSRAVNAHGQKWPEQLTSGVMFYEGERITRAEFLAEVRA